MDKAKPIFVKALPAFWHPANIGTIHIREPRAPNGIYGTAYRSESPIARWIWKFPPIIYHHTIGWLHTLRIIWYSHWSDPYNFHICQVLNQFIETNDSRWHQTSRNWRHLPRCIKKCTYMYLQVLLSCCSACIYWKFVLHMMLRSSICSGFY